MTLSNTVIEQARYPTFDKRKYLLTLSDIADSEDGHKTTRR